jgi:hypothetical protein
MGEVKPSGSRPTAVTIIAIFLFVATGAAFIVGTSLLFPNSLMDRLWQLNPPAEAAFRAMGRISSVPLLLLGVGTFAAGLGLLHARKWAWWFAVILFAINGAGDLVSFVATGDWLRSASGVVISSAFLWSLIGRRVRMWFSTNSDFSMK